jgi:Amt family ammonium transporter
VGGVILFVGIKKTFGLRVDKRIEEEGLDIYEHGESCYN